MNKRTRELVVTALLGAVLFAVAVTLVNVQSAKVAHREVERTNAALCDLLRFSATPGPTPPQPKVEPTSDFGKQLAEYNRIQAGRQIEGRAKVGTFIKRYC